MMNAVFHWEDLKSALVIVNSGREVFGIVSITIRTVAQQCCAFRKRGEYTMISHHRQTNGVTRFAVK